MPSLSFPVTFTVPSEGRFESKRTDYNPKDKTSQTVFSKKPLMSSTPEDKRITGRGSKVAIPKNNLVKDGVENAKESNLTRERRSAETKHQKTTTTASPETEGSTSTVSQTTTPDNADVDELQTLHLKLQNELNINMESARDWHFLSILLNYSSLCPEDSTKLDPIIEKANTNIARQTMALFYSQLVEYRDIIKSFDPEVGITYSNIIDSVEEKATAILNEVESEESSKGKALFDLITEAINLLKAVRHSGKFGLFFKGLRERQLEAARLQQPLSDIVATNEDERAIAASLEHSLDRRTLYEKLHQLISADEFEQAGRLLFFANAMIRGKEGTAYNHKSQSPFIDKLLEFEPPTLPSNIEYTSSEIQNDFEYGIKVALILASLKSYGGIWNEDDEFGAAFSFLQMLSGDNLQYLNNLLEQMTLSDADSGLMVKELTLAFQASYEYYLYTMVYPDGEKQRASATILRKLGVDISSKHFSQLQEAIGRLIGPMSYWEDSRSTPAEIISFLINKFDKEHGKDEHFNNLQIIIHTNRMGVQSPKYRTEFIRIGLVRDSDGLFSLTIGDSTKGSVRYSGMPREQLAGTIFNELFSYKIKHLLSLHFGALVGNDVSIPIQIVPASIHSINQLTVLQGSPLSLEDIISTPVSQLPQLERTRTMELTYQFFNTMKDRAVFTTLITPATQHTTSPTDTAIPFSNLTAGMQELLAIKKRAVDREELIKPGTEQLFKNVIKGFTGILRLSNGGLQSSGELSADARLAFSEFSSMVSDVLGDAELSISSDVRKALSEFNTQSQVYLRQHTEATTAAGNHQEPESQTKETSVIHSPGSKVLLNPGQLLRWIVGKLKGSETDAQKMTEQELVALFKDYERALRVFTPEEPIDQTEAPSLDTDQAINGLFKNSLNEIMEWHQGSLLEVHPDKNSYRSLTGNQPSFNLLSQWQKCFDASSESRSEHVSQTFLPPNNHTRSEAEDVTPSEVNISGYIKNSTTPISTKVPETTSIAAPTKPATTTLVTTTQSTQFILQNVLINAVKDTWVYKLQLRLLKYHDEAPDGESIQPVINTLEKLIKTDRLKVLKSWISAFIKAAKSSDPATARRFTSILDSIDSHETGSSEDEHSRRKRSPLNPSGLNYQVFSLLNQLASDEKAEAFTRFSQGIQSSITKHSLKLNNQISDSISTRSEILAEESKTRVITPSEMGEVKQQVIDYFAEGDYYSAGQTSFDLGEISVNQHVLARSSGNSESITETNDADTSLSQSGQIEINGNFDASLFEASCFMAIVTNPLFVRDALAGCTGYCKGFSFIQAIAGMKGISLNYRLLDMLAENQLDAGTLPQAIAVLQMLLNISHSSHLPDLNPAKAAFEAGRLKYFGFKKESLVFKNLLNKIDTINIEYHGLEAQDTTLDTALDALVDFYEAQKGAAQTSEIKGAEVGIAGTFYIKVPHMIRLALEENPEGGFYIIYENSQSSLIKIPVSSLSELKTDKVRQQFGEIIRSDLRNRYSYTDEQLRLVKLTPSILSEMATLQILPTSFLTLGDLVATPPSERALLEQGRKLQKLTELLTKLSQPSTRDAIRQGAFEGVVEDSTVNPNKVNSLSSFNQKVREVLEAIDLFERQGTAISSERIELIENILVTVTNELKLINSIPATVLGRWLTQEKLNNLRQLYQAMEALKEATAGSDFGVATDLNDAVTKLNTEVEAFTQKTQSISISELQLPDAESHPLPEQTISTLKTTLKKKARKIALEETPSTSSSATKEPSSEAIEKAEEQVATQFKDGADFFMAVVGLPPRAVATSTESNLQKLSNALNEAADQGLKETAGAGESWSRIPGKNDDAIDRLLQDESVRAFLKLSPSDFVSVTEGGVTVTAKVVGSVASGVAEVGGVAFTYRVTVGEWSFLYKPVGSSGAYMDAKDLPELEDLDITATDLNNNVQEGIEKLNSTELETPDVPDSPLEDAPVAKKPRVLCKRDLSCVSSEAEEGGGDSFADLFIDGLEGGAAADGLADTVMPAGAFFAGTILTVVGLGAAGGSNQNEQPQQQQQSPPANSPSDSHSHSPVTRKPSSGDNSNNQGDADRPAIDRATTDQTSLTTTSKPVVKSSTTIATSEQTKESTETNTGSNKNVTIHSTVSPNTIGTEKTTNTPTSVEQTTPASTVSQTTESVQEETTPVMTTVQDESAQRTMPESTITVTGEVATSNENASGITSSTSRIRLDPSAVSNSTLASPTTVPVSTPKTTNTPTSVKQTTPASTVSQTTESVQEETTPVMTTVQDESAQRTTPESTTTVTGEVATSNENSSIVTLSTSRIRLDTSAVSNSTLVSPTTAPVSTSKTTNTPASVEQTTPAPTLESQTKEVDKTPLPASTVSQTTESVQEETTPVMTTVQDESAQRTTPESTTTVTGEVATSNENASTVTSSTSRMRFDTSAVSNSTLASPTTVPVSTPAPGVEITSSANQNLKNNIDQLLQGFFKNSWISALFQQQKTILQSLPSSTASPALSFNQQKLDIFYRIAKLIALKEFTRAFITGVRTSDPDLASEFKTLGDYLSGRIEQIKQGPKARAKRSDNGSDGSESTKQEWTQKDINNFVDETLETFLDLLGESDHNQAFIEFSQGYKKRQDEYRKFIHDDVDIDDMSESDTLLERSATKIIKDTTLNQLKVAAAHSLDDQNYFQAGKQIFDIEMIEANVQLLLSGKRTVSQQSGADNLSEYSGIFSKIVFDAGEAVGTFKKFSILASELYAQVFSNPLLHQDQVLKCAGYCMGRMLFDAVSEQNPNNRALWNLLDDLFSPNGSPTATLNTIVALQIIADQAIYSQSENPEARHRATQALRKLQHLGYKTGSQSFQKISSQLSRLDDRFFSLPQKTVAIANIVGKCVNFFRSKEAVAEQQGQTFNSQQFFVNLSKTAGVAHVVRISVTKNAADKYMIAYENIQSVMFKIAADTLDGLASDENSEQFATHIENDLQRFYEYTGGQITLTKATAAFMGTLEDLVVLPGSALTVKDIATASQAELPVLEQQRQIGLFTDFFNFLAGTAGFQALKQTIPEGITSLPFTVTTKSPLIDQVKELLVSLHQKTEASTPIPIQTKLLAGNVLKKITGTLKLVNGMSDAEFSAGITEANLPLLQKLSQAIEAFKTTSLVEADDAEMSHLFGREPSEFIVEATKFSAKVATASTADRSQLPFSSSHKESELSDSQKAQLKTAINQKALKNAQLQAAHGALSSQPTPAELRQAKEQLAVSAQDGAHLFFSLTGRSPVNSDFESIDSSSLSEESTLLNEKLNDIALASLMEELERFPSFAKVAQHESDPIEDLFNDPIVDKFLGQKASLVTGGGDNVAGKVVGGIASGVITLGDGLALTYRVIKSGDGALQTVYRPLGQSNRALTLAEQQEADDLVSQEMNRRLPDANNDPLEPENSVEERIPVECGSRKKRSLEPCIPEEPEAVEETALEDGAGDSTLADVLIDGVVDGAFADEAVDAAPVLGFGAGSLLLIFGLSHSDNNQQRPSTTTATTTITTTTKRPESNTQKKTTTEVTKTTKPANKPITVSIPTTTQAATTPEETAPTEATHTKTTTPVTSDSTIPTTPTTRTTPSVTEITSGSTSSSEEQAIIEPETTKPPTTTTPSEEKDTTQGKSSTVALPTTTPPSEEEDTTQGESSTVALPTTPPSEEEDTTPGESSTVALPTTPPSEEEETTQAKVSTPMPSTTESKKSEPIGSEPPVAQPSLKLSRDLACKVLVKFDFPEWFARGVFTDEQVNHLYGNIMSFLESSLGSISEYLSSLSKATTLPAREARDLVKMFLTDDAALVVRTRLLSDKKFKPCVSREGEASYENDMEQKREIIDLVRLTWVKDKWFKEFASRRQGRVTRSLDHSRHSHRSTREKKRHILREFDRDLKRLEEEKSGAGNTEPAIRGRRKRAASRHSDELNEIARVQGVLRMVTNQLQSFEGVQLPEKNVRVRKNRKLNCRILGRYKPSSNSKSVASESSDSRVLEAAYNSLPSKLIAVQSMLTALLKHPRAGKINGLVPLLKMLKKMKALSDEREKLLRHGKFYQACTDKKGRPIAATSPEQTKLLIKHMRQFDVTVKQFEKTNQHLLSIYSIPSVTLHTRRSLPLGLSREAEIRVLRSIQTELEKSRRLVKQLKVATVKEMIQPAIRPVAILGTNITAPADNVVRHHHRRDTDAAHKLPTHHNRKLLSVGSEHLEEHRPLDGLFRENNDYQKPMSSGASRLESPINKAFQLLSIFAKENLNPYISEFFSQFTSYFNEPIIEESSENAHARIDEHANKENPAKALLKETGDSEASTRKWSTTVTVFGKCEGESNDCKAQVGVMTTHSDDPAFCHSQTQTPEDGKQCSSFKVRANSGTCEETEALNMENLFSKRRFSGNENSSWDDSRCDEQEKLATAAGSIKEMMKEQVLSKWQKSADYLNGTHGLHMPFTHKPTFLPTLDLFESSHGSLPEGFQRNDQGDILLTVTGESAFQFDLTNNQLKGEQPETESGVVTPERIDSIMKVATMDSRMAAYLQWQPIVETPGNLAEVLNLLACTINDRSMIKGHWSDVQKAEETGSHTSLIGVLQDGTDIAPELYKDVKNYIKLAKNNLCDMSHWTDSDLICISILQTYSAKTKELRSDVLAKRFIGELLDSPVGPESQSYSDLFDVEENGGVRIRGRHAEDNIKGMSSHRFFKLTTVYRQINDDHAVERIQLCSPQNGNRLELVRCMLNVMARSCLDYSGAKYIGVARQLLKEKRRINESNTEQVSLSQCQQLVDDWRKEAQNSEPDLKTRYVTDVITLINKKLKSFDMNSQDRIPLSIAIWERLHKIQSLSPDKAEYHSLLKDKAGQLAELYHQSYSNAVSSMPETMSSQDIDVVKELHRDVALICFHQLVDDVDSNELAHKISSMVSKEWQVVAKEHEEVNHETGAGFVRVSNITSSREKDLIKSLNRLPQQSNLCLPAACMPISLSAASTSTLPATMS